MSFLVRYRPLTRSHLEHYQRRISSIPLSRRPRWGLMDPPLMFAHMARSIALGMGEPPLEDQSNWLGRTLGRWFLTSTFPWPRGAKTLNIMLPEPEEGERERLRLLGMTERFVDTVEREPERIVVSPLFGPMPLKRWALALGRHLEHHLRQFDV